MIDVHIIEELEDLVAWYKMAMDTKSKHNPMGTTGAMMTIKIMKIIDKYKPEGMTGN